MTNLLSRVSCCAWVSADRCFQRDSAAATSSAGTKAETLAMTALIWSLVCDPAPRAASRRDAGGAVSNCSAYASRKVT